MTAMEATCDFSLLFPRLKKGSILIIGRLWSHYMTVLLFSSRPASTCVMWFKFFKVQASKPSTISYRYTLDQLSDLIGLTHRKLKFRYFVRFHYHHINLNIANVNSIVPEEGWFGQPKYSTKLILLFYVVSVSAFQFQIF